MLRLESKFGPLFVILVFSRHVFQQARQVLGDHMPYKMVPFCLHPQFDSKIYRLNLYILLSNYEEEKRGRYIVYQHTYNTYIGPSIKDVRQILDPIPCQNFA